MQPRWRGSSDLTSRSRVACLQPALAPEIVRRGLGLDSALPWEAGWRGKAVELFYVAAISDRYVEMAWQDVWVDASRERGVGSRDHAKKADGSAGTIFASSQLRESPSSPALYERALLVPSYPSTPSQLPSDARSSSIIHAWLVPLQTRGLRDNDISPRVNIPFPTPIPPLSLLPPRDLFLSFPAPARTVTGGQRASAAKIRSITYMPHTMYFFTSVGREKR